jgi:hypothetical protein
MAGRSGLCDSVAPQCRRIPIHQQRNPFGRYALEQVWNNEGAMTKFEGEITVYELNKVYGLHLNNKNTQVDVLYILKKSGAKTHLTQETTFQYSGMMKLIDKVAVAAIQKSYIDQAKQNFSRLIELCTEA